MEEMRMVATQTSEAESGALPPFSGGRKKKTLLKSNKKDLAFYIALMAWPVLQFAVCYIWVNVSSFLMAFQDINVATGVTTWTWKNFANIITEISWANLGTMALNSVLAWVLLLVISIPLGLLFSYYIYKKMPGSIFFRAVLFLPSIVSAIVMVTIFRYFVSSALPSFVQDLFGAEFPNVLDPATGYAFWTVIFYTIWVGFGTSVLMYSNGMSGIDPELVDAAHIDGATGIREFWHITLPLVFPTLSVFLITSIANIFINQINLYSFYGGTAHSSIQTFGYYLYMAVKRADGDYGTFPRLAAFGLILTAIAIPLTLFVRWLLEKFGPSEN